MPLDHECPTAGTRCPICEPLSDVLRSALNATWSAIGADCLAAMADGDDPESGEMDRQSAIEVVLDCDRIEQYGYLNKDGRQELAEFRKLPYEVQRALAATVFTDSLYCF